MTIVYYTSSVAGTGRIVQGLSIRQALLRRGFECRFIILSNAEEKVAAMADRMGAEHIEIPAEPAERLDRDHYADSLLFLTLKELDPDLLIVDRLWFTLQPFIDRIPCPKFFFTIQVSADFYRLPRPDGSFMEFNPAPYERIFTIEPFEPPFEAEALAPFILRNRDEIYSRQEACRGLKLDPAGGPYALIALNYKPGYFETMTDKYRYLEQEGYQIIASTNLGGGGIFPVVDYFAAFDLIVCAAGYTQFWETRYFRKKTLYECMPLHFSSMEWRQEQCSELYYEENGCDTLAEMITDKKKISAR